MPLGPALLLLLVLSLDARAWTVEGRVVKVKDGDTITILDASRTQHRIRLSGIDAPEIGQPFGRTARRALVALAAGHQALADCNKRDRWSREVCSVTVEGEDVGERLVGDGMAWVFARYVTELRPPQRRAYQAAEHSARAVGAGLWSDVSPVAPWDWRKMARTPR